MIPAETVKQTMLFILQSFKYGRALEDTIMKMPDNQAQLSQLQTQLQEQGQQLEQATAQAQQLQSQLDEIDQADQETKKLEAGAKANLQDQQAEKTKVETDLLRQSAGAESAVSEQANMAAMTTAHASMTLEQMMQQFQQMLPALAQLVAQSAKPKAKAGRMWRNEDGTHGFAVDEMEQPETGAMN
jgi:chromosome segregation ATPase